MLIRPTKALRTAPGESAEQWLSALADPAWLGAAKILKEDDGSWVRRATILGRDVVVKCRALNTLSRRLKSTLGMGHGDKHWRGAELLRRAKVRTADTLLLAHASVDSVRCEVLVLEYLPGRTLLECLSDAASGAMPVRSQHAIARAVGEQVSSMGWVFNRDNKPSNLIVMTTRDRLPEIAVIDCVGVNTRQVPQTARMFASLVIEPLGCNIPPRRSLMSRAVRSCVESLDAHHDPSDDEDDLPEPPMTPRERVRFLTRLHWRKAATIITAHGDPTPKINPLRPPGA